jgi:hypothetical protein
VGNLFGSLAVGAASVFLQTRKIARRAVIVGSILLCVTVILFFNPSLQDTAIDALETMTGILGGFACDVAFIILTRRLLRWAGGMTSSLKVFATVFLTLLLAIFLILPALYNTPPYSEQWGSPIEFVFQAIHLVGQSNILDALLALLFVLLAAILLIHRLLWPLLTRTLFRAQEVGTKGRRAILTTVGLALLAAGVTGRVPELVQKLIEKLGG